MTSAAEEFDTAASNATLHSIASHDMVGEVSKAEMIKVYDDRMVGGPGRDAYDRLRNVPNGECPLCTEGNVSTLDHHLPKTLFPALAVTPANLVPACADCNKTKRSVRFETPESQTLHPYYDDVSDGRWLYANLDEESAVMRFIVRAPEAWSDLKAARVASHFSLFKLDELFSLKSARDLADMTSILQRRFPKEDGSGIADYLRELAEDYASVDINSRKRALFEAVSDSRWYCTGGYEAWGRDG